MKRGDAYKEGSSRFYFLNDMDLSEEKYSQDSQKLVESHPVDLNMNLCGERRQFHCYMRTKFNEISNTKFSHIDLCDTIVRVRKTICISKCRDYTTYFSNIDDY
ncbi:hypothetical protein FKM82_022958 [Ascaphus truei]